MEYIGSITSHFSRKDRTALVDLSRVLGSRDQQKSNLKTELNESFSFIIVSTLKDTLTATNGYVWSPTLYMRPDSSICTLLRPCYLGVPTAFSTSRRLRPFYARTVSS